MTAISNAQSKLIHQSISYLQTEYQQMYGGQHSEYVEPIPEVATLALETIARCDAPYHNLEHTIQVVLVGQEILYGKFLCNEPVLPSAWLNFIVSLLCHDIGYVKGVCQGDRPDQHRYVTGCNDETVTLSEQATGASLTPYHVDRGKIFIQEQFADHSLLDLDAIHLNIELTRFPVPKDDLHQDTIDFPGLTRAADLIGQLADPSYLPKLPSLFREFEETGSNQALGYKSPQDLRAGYPRFYWQGVSLYLQHGIRYLEMSQSGQAILANLYDNRSVVEKELDRFYHSNHRFWLRLRDWIRQVRVSMLPQ